MDVQDTTRQTWFYVGLALAFLRPVLQSSFTHNLMEDIRHFSYMARRTWEGVARLIPKKQAHDHGQQSKTSSNQYQNNHNQGTTNQTDRERAWRGEQARREAEARERRAKQDRDRAEEQARERAKTQRGQGTPPPPPPTQDARSYMEILGLKEGWTQDDLKTAYRRECQRLHPDKWSGKPDAIRAILEAEYKMVQKAYHALKT